MQLRPYQTDAIERVVEKIKDRKLRKFVLQAFVGAGKTVIAAEVIRRAIAKGSRVLVIAHRNELINQVYRKLVEIGVPETEIWNLQKRGVPKSQITACKEHVFVGSVQMRSLPNNFDIVIIDEAHRSAADSYVKVVTENPTAVILGLTATPSRLDGKPLGDIYDDIVVIAQPSTLVAGGFIAKPRVFTVPDEFLPDTSGIGKSKGDFVQKQLDGAVSQKKLVGSIVDHWMARGRGLPTIAFATSVNHSKMIVDAFVQAGVKAIHIDGTSKESEREDAIQGLKNGTIEVVSSVEIWIEGIDIPEAKCAILARPTESLVIFIQSCGRVLRPYGGITPIILDHAGNARRHGLPTEDRVYDLHGKPKRASGDDSVPSTRTCAFCLTVCEADMDTCPNCGNEFPKRGGERSDMPETEDGTLVELPERGSNASTYARRRYWDASWNEAWKHGYLPSWVHERFVKRFGESVPHDWEAPERPPIESTESEQSADITKWASVASKQGLPMDWARKRFEMKHGIVLDSSKHPIQAFSEMRRPKQDARRAQRCAERATAKPSDGVLESVDSVDATPDAVVDVETGEL